MQLRKARHERLDGMSSGHDEQNNGEFHERLTRRDSNLHMAIRFSEEIEAIHLKLTYVGINGS